MDQRSYSLSTRHLSVLVGIQFWKRAMRRWLHRLSLTVPEPVRRFLQLFNANRESAVTHASMKGCGEMVVTSAGPERISTLRPRQFHWGTVKTAWHETIGLRAFIR